MVSLDLSTSRAPVINLSGKTTEQAFAEACGYPLSRVLLQDLSPKKKRRMIPVRIIEGMETVADRGTVNGRQAFLI